MNRPADHEYVRTALQIACTCEKRRRFAWLTRKGVTSTMELPRGWLTVRDALRLPEPDTSWMSNPIRRSEFTRTWKDGGSPL